MAPNSLSRSIGKGGRSMVIVRDSGDPDEAEQLPCSVGTGGCPVMQLRDLNPNRASSRLNSGRKNSGDPSGPVQFEESDIDGDCRRSVAILRAGSAPMVRYRSGWSFESEKLANGAKWTDVPDIEDSGGPVS